MEKQKATVGCSLPSVGIILTLIFVVLKLTGNIGWAWVWVVSPLWISFGLLLGFIALMLALSLAVVALAAIIAIVFDK